MRTIRKNLNSQKGFTLIEMAVVLIIIGIMIGAFFTLYNQYMSQQKVIKTEESIGLISQAIGTFRAVNGRYPCPASLTAVRLTDPAYGHENCVNYSGVAAGSDLNGVFVEQSTRAAYPFNDPHDSPDTGMSPKVPRVLVGAIPFRALNLDEKIAYDGYGNRITYVVTEHMAYGDSFQIDGGGIEILNEQGVSSITVPASAHFLVISSGESDNGAFTASGTQFPCPATGFESENCDFQTDPDATYQTVKASGSGDPDLRYDDTVVYYTRSEIPLWQLSTDPAHSLDIHQKGFGQVGISIPTATDTIDSEAQVAGAVRAGDDPDTGVAIEGEIQTQSICDDINTTDCFPSSLIAGQLADGEGMRCPEDDPDGVGEFMVAIQGRHPVCEDEVTVSCPAGSYMLGFNADGTPNCDIPPAGCPPTINICGADQNTTPNNVDGGIVTLTAPDTKSETWRCNGTNWELVTASGDCTCVPNSWDDYDVPCASNFDCHTGNIHFTNPRWDCPGGWSAGSDYSQCVCQNGCVRRTSASCSEIGLSGGVYYAEITMNCSYRGNYAWAGPNVGSFDPATYRIVDQSQCGACVPQTETRNMPCPSGTVANPNGITEQRQFTCPGATWSGWTETSNDCVCNNNTTENRNDPCPAGQSGVIVNQYRFNCATSTWSFVREVSRTCAPISYELKPVGGSQGGAGGGTPLCGDTCNTPFAPGLSCKSGTPPRRYNAVCEPR